MARNEMNRHNRDNERNSNWDRDRANSDYSSFDDDRNSTNDRLYGNKDQSFANDRTNFNNYSTSANSSRYGSHGYGRDFDRDQDQSRFSNNRNSERSSQTWGDHANYSGYNPTATQYNSSDRYSENIGNSSSMNTHYGKGPKGWKRSEDRIREDVSEALYRSHDVDASDIDVSVKDGMVTLKGSVSTREAKRTAERIIENLSGVDDVQNEIRVTKSEATASSTKSTTGKLS